VPWARVFPHRDPLKSPPEAVLPQAGSSNPRNVSFQLAYNPGSKVSPQLLLPDGSGVAGTNQGRSSPLYQTAAEPCSLDRPADPWQAEPCAMFGQPSAQDQSPTHSPQGSSRLLLSTDPMKRECLPASSSGQPCCPLPVNRCPPECEIKLHPMPLDVVQSGERSHGVQCQSLPSCRNKPTVASSKRIGVVIRHKRAPIEG